VSAAFDTLLPVRQSEFVITSVMQTMCSKLDSSTEGGQIFFSADGGCECIRFCEEQSEVRKSKSARKVHNALRWLDRLAGLGRKGHGWPAKRSPEAAI
jgi:hypothetical protein